VTQSRRRIVLASASPRRRRLLEQLGLQPLVHPSRVAEGPLPPGVSPADWAESLARRKAVAVAPSFPRDIVVAADTIVVLGDCVLGKPGDEREAAAMLRALSGREHAVITGVCTVLEGGSASGRETTRVRFRDLSPREIAAYAATPEPLDKAGAYGIQGVGGLLVASISGCYNNVVGLPLVLLLRLLRRLGVDLLDLVAVSGPNAGEFGHK